MKKCTICKIRKHTIEYGYRKETLDNLRSECRKCSYAQALSRKRTKKGLISNIYSEQIQNSKKRNHKPPTYTRKELIEWMFSQKKFHLLYDNWKRLDYQKSYRPSIDRIENEPSYTMANIQLMTWGENKAKGESDHKNNIKIYDQKKVTMYSKKGAKIANFPSIMEAFRQTGCQYSSISLVCSGKRKTAGGFIWKLTK